LLVLLLVLDTSTTTALLRDTSNSICLLGMDTFTSLLLLLLDTTATTTLLLSLLLDDTAATTLLPSLLLDAFTLLLSLLLDTTAATLYEGKHPQQHRCHLMHFLCHLSQSLFDTSQPSVASHPHALSDNGCCLLLLTDYFSSAPQCQDRLHHWVWVGRRRRHGPPGVRWRRWGDIATAPAATAAAAAKAPLDPAITAQGTPVDASALLLVLTITLTCSAMFTRSTSMCTRFTCVCCRRTSTMFTRSTSMFTCSSNTLMDTSTNSALLKASRDVLEVMLEANWDLDLKVELAATWELRQNAIHADGPNASNDDDDDQG
jgi:hypothetical protein